MARLLNKENQGTVYFDGNKELLDSAYLKRILVKKRYRTDFFRGEIIASPEEAVEDCYFIEKGSVLMYEQIGKKRRIFNIYYPGQILFCANAVFPQQHSFIYEANSDCELYCIRVEKVRKLLKNNKNFSGAFIRQLTWDYFIAMDLLRKSAIHNISWMVSDLLIVLAGFESQDNNGVIFPKYQYTQTEIADMLHINRVTCLRELHKLAELGLISLDGRKIGIKDLPKLIEYRDRQSEGTKEETKE